MNELLVSHCLQVAFLFHPKTPRITHPLACGRDLMTNPQHGSGDITNGTPSTASIGSHNCEATTRMTPILTGEETNQSAEIFRIETNQFKPIRR